MAEYRVFKAEFRISLAQPILDGESVSSLSGKYKIKRSILYRWRDLLRDQGAAGFHRLTQAAVCMHDGFAAYL